ncbi:hypothetical protein BC629DRAFT_1730271 [Irpex lacteus]|nr:hypothetical protein BC629DRAFT_1730271 [Irpex lacteus]
MGLVNSCGLEARLVIEDVEDAKEGEPGELWIRGPTIMKGFQVPPAELEAILLQHPDIADCAVIGIISAEQATELPRAYVVHAKGIPPSEHEAFGASVQEWIKTRVARHKQLRGGVIVTDAIPKRFYDANYASVPRRRDCVDQCPEDIMEIHIFADSKSALSSLLDPKTKPGQRDKLWACSFIRAFLDGNPDRRIGLHWVPGHVGIKQNEDIDKLAKEATELDQPNHTTLSVAKQNIDAAALKLWQGMMREPRYAGHQNLIKLGEHKHVRPVAKQHWWLRTLGGADNRDCLSKTTGHTELYARATRLISGHMPIGEYRKDFKLDGRTTCACGSPDTREHMLTNCPLWIRCWPTPPPLTPEERDLLEGMDPVDARDVQQSFGKEEIAHFLLMNPMAGTFEWADLCDKRDADLEEGKLDSYAVTRVIVETSLEKKVYEAYINRVNLVTTENVLIGQANSFHQQWGSSHEWTIRILCEKNVIDPEAALESDQFPRRLPPAKKPRKPKQPKKNRELCRSQFADWVFNNLDRNLTFHPPPYRWDEKPRLRPRNHEGRIMRDALNFDSDDDEEEEYIPLLPRVILQASSTSSRPAPPARDDPGPELERVRRLTGPSSSMVQEAAPVGQRRRALRAKNTGGTYLFINTASSPEASGTQDNVQTQEKEGIGDFFFGCGSGGS